MKFTFFRLPSVRKFDYKPRYFDPEKEKREARKREILGDSYSSATESSTAHAFRIKGAMSQKHKNYTEIAKKESKRSNLRLIIIIIILSAIAYYLYYSSGEWLNLMLHK